MRGATVTGKEISQHIDGFNPRPYARGDSCDILIARRSEKFQSTPLCEGRLIKYDDAELGIVFQSTPLCEGRQKKNKGFGAMHRFNPRPYARGDRTYQQLKHLKGVSIHAPMRGATV